MSQVIAGLGWVLGLAVYVLTIIGVANLFGLGWAAIAFFVPPADLVFAWLVSPLLGVGSLVAIGLFALGAAMDPNRDNEVT